MEVRPGYKQTEVGVIPNDWGTASLLAVADSLDNVRVPLNEPQRQRMQGDIPYCGANGVLDYVSDFVIDDDIILMAEDGGYFDEYASRPIAYRMKGKCWVNNHAHILKLSLGMTRDSSSSPSCTRTSFRFWRAARGRSSTSRRCRRS